MAEETTHPQTPLSNPALAQLESFAGTWQWEASVDGQPIGRGPTTFAWLEGGTFLVEHADAEQAEFPSSTAIFGCDDTTETYCMFQVDSRGISRIYQMSLRHGVWKLWRDAPGFSQRFEGTFSDDGKTISGRWEKSGDGAPEHTAALLIEKVLVPLKRSSMPELHTLLTDLALGESPRWHAGRLWLCDSTR